MSATFYERSRFSKQSLAQHRIKQHREQQEQKRVGHAAKESERVHSRPGAVATSCFV